MSLVRRFPLVLHVWLALSLALAPLFPAHAMPAEAPAPAMAVDAHAGHDMAGGQDSTLTDCATQGDCQDACCAACGHCAGMATASLERSAGHKATLTPREPRLFSFVYLPLRERPPRHFTA